MSIRRSIFSLLCLAALAAGPSVSPTTRPATRPTSRPTSRPSPASRPSSAGKEDVLKPAVIELLKEATTAEQKRQPFPRTEPDYFVGKSVTLDQDALLKLLVKQIARDPRSDAYVKLQLLSGVEKFDVANARAAIAAYIAAPALIPIPSSQKDMQQWDQKAMNAKQSDLDKINEGLLAWRKTFEDNNATIIQYREAMKDRIVVGDDMKPRLLEAQIEEMSQRATAGFDTWKQQGKLFTEVLAWAALAKRAEVHAMTGFASEYVKRSPPELYDKLMWSDRKSGTYWRMRKAGLDPKKLGSLIEGLKQAETNAM